jgi:hypothetical protein
MDHAYDDPEIGPIEFLLAVLHDPTVPIQLRADAARHLCSLGYGDLSQVPPRQHVTIHITGGLPKLLDTPPCTDINDCINRTTPCPWSDIMRSVQGVNYKSCREQIDHSPMVPIATRKDLRLQ